MSSRPLPKIPARPPSKPLPPIPLNSLTKMLRDRPLDLFRNYSVSPPDGALGDEIVDHLGTARRQKILPVGARTRIATDGMFSRFFKPEHPITTEFKHAPVNKKIAWIQLQPHESFRGALTFQAIIPSTPDKVPAGHLPVWFLPWESHHLIDMTIPMKQNDDDDDPNDPKLFFTAAINGCSVFVRGDPRSPTVSHAGISQVSTPYGGDPSTFWRHLLEANLAANDIHGGKTWEVNNTDYINQTGVSGGARTANSDAYLRWLKTLPSGPITVIHVVPWGCVFGVRYGRLWTFYLQENATVFTYRLVSRYENVTVTDKQKVIGPFQRNVTNEVSIKRTVKLESTVNRPIVLRDFFPGAGGKANFIDRWQGF
ncbi:MAG: hypothetical protein LC114_21045 [Bryobacterales bacterium]|nr:hypothetical protein [Bryobacterales bacterium]